MNYKIKLLFLSSIVCLDTFVSCGGEFSELVDLSCQTAEDCSSFVKPSQNITCLDQQCTCLDQNSIKVECSPPESFISNIIGGVCPCTQEHSECNTKSQVCYCKKEYTATLDKRRCVKRQAQLGETCESNFQCIYEEKFSECDMQEKICKCQKDFVESNNACISVVNLEEHCESDMQCENRTANSFCAFKRCACKEGFVSSVSKTKCLPGVEHDGDCMENNQCKLKLGIGSFCYSGKCMCDVKHHILETISKKTNEKHYTCEKEVYFGDYCYEHSDCYKFNAQSHNQSMECFHGECACRPDFRAINNTCVYNGAQAIRMNMFFTLLIGITCILLATLWTNSISKIQDL